LDRVSRGESSQLISEAGKSAGQIGRRQFIQVDGNNAPSSLHHELNQKSTYDEQGRVRRKNPKRDQQHSADRGEDDHAAAAPMLRKMTDDYATANRSQRINDTDHGLRAYAKAALLLQTRRVKVLCPMAHAVSR